MAQLTQLGARRRWKPCRQLGRIVAAATENYLKILEDSMEELVGITTTFVLGAKLREPGGETSRALVH